MSIRSLVTFLSILCMYPSSLAIARDITITRVGGDDNWYSVIRNELTTDGWMIEVQGRGNPAMQLNLTATSGINSIKWIGIRSRGTNCVVNLSISENGGTISTIRKIQRVAAASDNGELWIGSLRASGALGDANDSSETISADIVSDVVVGGSIYAPVISGPRLFGGDSTIVRLESTGGGVFGNVSTLFGAIDNLVPAGDIGTSTIPVNIYAMSHIKTVIANSIWAHIDSTQNGGSENVYYIKTRLGNLNGSVKAFRIESDQGANASGLSIAGDLNANVTTLSHLREPIVVGGSVPASTTIDIGGQVLTREAITGDSGSVVVAGDFAGTLLVGDKLYGNVSFSGSLASTGVIRIANDVFTGTSSGHTYSGSMTFGGSCAGLVRIGGSLSGPITCSTNSGLTGQVVINAANASGSWTNTANSLVTLKDNTGANVVLAPNQPPPRTAPYYEVASSGLGGGAIGLVPYHLYQVDCDPPYAAEPGGTLLDSQFNHRNPLGSGSNNRSVVLRFYGPVYKPTSASPVKLEYLWQGDWIDRTGSANIDCEDSSSSTLRTISIYGGTASQAFYKGEYRVSLIETSETRLRCAQTTAASPPVVPSFGYYYFTLVEDCNNNNSADALDLTVHYNNDPEEPKIYDWNNDGLIDACDRDGFCIADFNMDGFVNGDDYDLFGEFFDIAHPIADLNLDGFVNGNDYDAFAEVFDTGC